MTDADAHPQRYLVTAALPYSNGRLHVGHIAGAYLPADITVRYRRLRGDDVKFICGSDDNGVAITIKAEEENTTPAQIVEKFHGLQEQAFHDLNIQFDVYGGTHTPGFIEKHNQFSQDFFLSLHNKGGFEKKLCHQLFDTERQRFLPDRYVTGTCHHCGFEGATGDQCESCGNTIDPLLLKNPVSKLTGTTPEPRETMHWFLKLNNFEQPLKDWLDTKTNWRPTVVNFTKGQIKQGLPQRAMTRDLTWGVPLPLDDPDAQNKVLYVWFDAPIGYVSFTAQSLENEGKDPGEYTKYWKDPDCKILHFIGEDNIVFHAIIWPAMLMAEGTYQLPTHVVANSFLNIKFPGKEEEKFSKSRGNAIWIDEFLQEYEADPLRYYLTAIAPESARTAYDPEDFLQRNDSELVAALGNFINRNITFAHKYFEGKVPAQGTLDEVDTEFLQTCQTQAQKVGDLLDQFSFKAALAELMALARAGNGYLDVKKPWQQRKEDLAACGTTVNVCLQSIRTLATLMLPFLPTSGEKALAMLSIPLESVTWHNMFDQLPDGQPLNEHAILFKKLIQPAGKK